MELEVVDPRGDLDVSAVKIFHNGIDVTETLMRQASSSVRGEERKILLTVPVVRLPAAEDNLIEVTYQGQSGAYGYARFEEPECMAFRLHSVSNTADFSPSERVLKMIEEESVKEGFSPAFTAGLVAQESGFDPRVISWAKAIGLTQMTTLAEQEVIHQFPDFPRYPQAHEMPVPWLRALVMLKKMNPENEWRLDTRKSVRGGLAYAHYLADRWSTPENLDYIRKTFPDPEMAHTQLMLASYNAGYSRVYASLKKHGRGWLKTQEMRGIRGYVNRTVSYCYHFSKV
ncbi:MAG: transglycosylase SLT domain-containing protein [Bacteriovoracia bacterium]